jgi:ABC-type nitrate/sulfonate/bicarbonate transport system permease component
MNGRKTDRDRGDSRLSRYTKAFRYHLPALISFATFFLIWEALVDLRGIQPIYLPAPSLIVGTLVSMTLDGTILFHLGFTLLRIFSGFAIAAAIGVGLGIAMGMSQLCARILDPWIAALYPLPKISLIPLLIIWLGTGEIYKISIAVFSAFLPIVITTYAGIRQIEPDLLLTAADLGANKRQTQFKIVVPAAVPSIVAGLQLGMGIAIIMVVAAEMIGGSGQTGIGYLLISAGQVLETEKVFACLIVLAVVGGAILKGQDYASRFFAPWAFAQAH